MSLTLEQATAHAQAALARAASRGNAVSAAVLDASFHLKAGRRADGPRSAHGEGAAQPLRRPRRAAASAPRPWVGF